MKTTLGERNDRGRAFFVVAGTVRGASRWYRVAAERNVVTFKLEWTTVCVPESRVGSLSSSGQDGPSGVRAYIRAARLYTPRQHRGGGLTDEGSYSKQRVAPKPSSRHAILSFHNERVPSRSVSRWNFNTLVYLTNVRPLPHPSPFPLFLFPRIFAPASFSSSSSSASSTSFSFSSFSYPPLLPLIRPTLFRPLPLCVPFSVEFLQVLPIYQEENSFAGRKIAFLYFPATKERTGKTRRGCETGIGNLLSVKRARSPANLSRTKLLTDPWCLDRSLALPATRDSYTPRELVK